MRDVDGHHQRQVRCGEPRYDQRRHGQQHGEHVGQRGGHHACRDRTEPLGRVLAVRLDVARVVDQVDRRRRETEHHERDTDLDQHVAVVVHDVTAEGGHRRGEHQQVLHPLARPDRLDDPGEQVLRRADDGRGFLTHRGHVSFDPNGTYGLGDDGADHHPGEDVGRVVHTKNQAGQRHRRHQQPRQRQPRHAAQQDGRRRGRRGVGGREAQPARRADVDGDRGVLRPLPLDDPLDHHRSRRGRGMPPHRPPTMRACDAAGAVRPAARRRPIPHCVHRSATARGHRSAPLAGKRSTAGRRRAPHPHPAGYPWRRPDSSRRRVIARALI